MTDKAAVYFGMADPKIWTIQHWTDENIVLFSPSGNSSLVIDRNNGLVQMLEKRKVYNV